MPRKHTQLSLKCNGISRMLEMCPLILPSRLILTALNPLLTIKYALNIREAAPVQRHNLSDAVWLSIWHFHRLVRSELHAELNLNIHINMVPNSLCGCVLFPKSYACEKPLERFSNGKMGLCFYFYFLCLSVCCLTICREIMANALAIWSVYQLRLFARATAWAVKQYCLLTMIRFECQKPYQQMKFWTPT